MCKNLTEYHAKVSFFLYFCMILRIRVRTTPKFA